MTADRNELCDNMSMYVLSGLDKEEHKTFEEHLEHCPECRKEVADMKELIHYLPLATQDVEPPAGMKSRILSHVLQSSEKEIQEIRETVSSHSSIYDESASSVSNWKEETAGQHAVSSKEIKGERRNRQRRSRLVAMLGIASVLLLTITSILAVRLSGLNEDKSTLLAEVSQLRGELAASNDPVAGLQVHNVVALKPTVKDLVAQGTAMIVIDNKGTHLIVQAEKLPELKGNEAFQVWLLKAGKPVNAGTFITRDGTGALYYTFPPDEYDTIAITQEPDANGKEPRGDIVLAAGIELSGSAGGA
jgi:anti-sigma factor RsiW